MSGTAEKPNCISGTRIYETLVENRRDRQPDFLQTRRRKTDLNQAEDNSRSVLCPFRTRNQLAQRSGKSKKKGKPMNPSILVKKAIPLFLVTQKIHVLSLFTI